MSKLRQLIYLFLSFQIGICNSQTNDISQYFSNQLYSNPSFAGTNYCPKYYIAYRNQLNNIAYAYTSYYASYDQHINKLNFDIGILLYRDVQGNKTFKNTYGGLILAKEFNTRAKTSFKLGAEIGYLRNKVSFENASFADMIHPYYGFIYSTNEPAETYADGHLNTKASFLLINEKAYLGLAINNLNNPKNKKTEEDFIKHRGLNATAGYEFSVKTTHGEAFLMPTFLYDYQNFTNSFCVGVYTGITKIIAGCWLKSATTTNAESFTGMIGFVEKKFKFAYSCDYATLRGDFIRFNTHELSLTLTPGCSERKKKVKAIKCPGI